jgi:hypothetical protein
MDSIDVNTRFVKRKLISFIKELRTKYHDILRSSYGQ